MVDSITNIGSTPAQYHLRQVFVYLDMYLLNRPQVMIGNASERFGQNGNLKDEDTREHIQGPVEALVAWTRQDQVARTV